MEKKQPEISASVEEGKIMPYVSSSGIYTIQINNTQLSHYWFLDTGCGSHIFYDIYRIKESKEVEDGRLNPIMGNMRTSPVTNIGTYILVLDSGVRFD